MSRRTLARLGGLAAILAGVFWAFTLPLIATQATLDPTGLRYDDFNRWRTLSLLLVVATLVLLRALTGTRLPRAGRLGWTVALAGASLMVLGNLVEFWLIFLTDDFVTPIAEDRNVDEWVGSTIGWLIFLAGLALLLAGSIPFSAAASRAGALPLWAGFALVTTAPLLLAAIVMWSRTVLGTTVVGVILALAWIALGLALRAGPAGEDYKPVVATDETSSRRA